MLFILGKLNFTESLQTCHLVFKSYLGPIGGVRRLYPPPFPLYEKGLNIFIQHLIVDTLVAMDKFQNWVFTMCPLYAYLAKYILLTGLFITFKGIDHSYLGFKDFCEKVFISKERFC